jgi:probable phosphoglycerate mutase
MRLFLIRHGESYSNAHWDQVKKPTDLNSVLTDKGIDQAEKLAEWMRANLPSINQIYASSLRRAEQTARPISEAFGVPVQIDHRIREGGYNYTDGSPIPDHRLPMEKSNDFHLAPNAPFDSTVQNCESYVQLKHRVGEFLDVLLDTHLDESIVISSHGWTINAFYDVIFSACALRQCYFFIENTALSYFQYNPEKRLGPWYAHFLAQTPHLLLNPEGFQIE